MIGRGERGARTGDDLTRVFMNRYVIIACSAEQAQRVTGEIRPILRQFGGIGLVSDAQWVEI